MKMYKSLLILAFSCGSLVLTQCGSSTTVQKDAPMELQKPSFANSVAHFNTYASGVEGGGSGIEFYIQIGVLPEEISLENVFFRESVGKLMVGNAHYVARFRTDLGKSKDVIMSSDPNAEAVNVPPVQMEKFPFPLKPDEAGISYREKGVLKYTKITKIEEREAVAYPSQRPRDGGY